MKSKVTKETALQIAAMASVLVLSEVEEVVKTALKEVPKNSKSYKALKELSSMSVKTAKMYAIINKKKKENWVQIGVQEVLINEIDKKKISKLILYPKENNWMICLSNGQFVHSKTKDLITNLSLSPKNG